MSDKLDITGTIKVEDQASPTIRRIQQSIAKMTEGARKVGAQFSRFANMGALGGLAKNAGRAAGAVRTLGGSIARLGGTVAGVLGVAGFGGLALEVTNYINSTDALAKTSSKIGISVEQLQQLRHAAGLSGVEIGQLESSLGLLNLRMGDAAAGKNKDLAELMKKLGINLRDANGQVRNAADVLPQLANAFKNNTNATTRARMANELFGKSGASMINLLKEGGPAIKEMMDEMVRLGLITTEQAKAAEAANDAQARMNTAMRGVSDAIMGGLIPMLTPLIEKFTEWLVVNREWIKLGVSKFFDDMVAALKKVDWNAVVEQAKAFGNALKWVWDTVGGVNAVLPAFAAIMAGVVLSALGGVIKAVGMLTAALVTNPIGAAIAAIAVAALAIIYYWEPISQFFVDMWGAVKDAFNTAVGWFHAFIEWFTPENIQQAWGELTAFFGRMWDGVSAMFSLVTGNIAEGVRIWWANVKGTFSEAVAWVDGFVGRFVPGGLLAVWEGLSTALSAIWNGPRVAFEAIITWLATFIARFTPQPILDAWGAVTGFFTGLWNSVTGIFEGAWARIKPIIDAIMSAIGPLIEAAGKVAAIGGAVGGAVSSAATSLANIGKGKAPEAGIYGSSSPAAETRSAASMYGGVNPVQAAQQAAPAPVARLDGEVQTVIKVQLEPGLRGTATTQDKGKVNSTVNVGTSMVPQ